MKGLFTNVSAWQQIHIKQSVQASKKKKTKTEPVEVIMTAANMGWFTVLFEGVPPNWIISWWKWQPLPVNLSFPSLHTPMRHVRHPHLDVSSGSSQLLLCARTYVRHDVGHGTSQGAALDHQRSLHNLVPARQWPCSLDLLFASCSWLY